MEQKLVKGHVLDRSESSGSVFRISEFRGNLFASLWVFLHLKVFLSYGRLPEYSDLHLIYRNAK